MLFIPRPKHSKARPKTQGQGLTSLVTLIVFVSLLVVENITVDCSVSAVLHDVAECRIPTLLRLLLLAKDASMAPSQKDTQLDCQPSHVGRKPPF